MTLETQFDELEKRFNTNDAELRKEMIYLDSLGLCMTTIRCFFITFPQLKLSEELEDKKYKWALLDSSISLIKTLNKRLARMIPRAEDEIDFWMNQVYDKSHKSLILNNADILSMSLKNLIDGFERQLELIEAESKEEQEVAEIILNLTKLWIDLEDKINKANKEAQDYYLKETVNKKERFKKYVEFKRSLSYNF